MIVLKNISKKLQEKAVLYDISFHISPNENVGIIGLNGAGKTTLLNVMAGIIKPDSGFIRVGGVENVIGHKEVLRDVTYVSGIKTQLWVDIKIKDSFAHCIQMYRISKEDAWNRFEELDKVFEVQKFLQQLPRDLSLGERMRCELVYALLAKPKVLLLDEAMIGLDVSHKYKIMQYFSRLRKEKQMTIIYTSHNLQDVEKLCDRIILINHGRIIFDGSVDRIMKEFSPLYQMEIKIGECLPDLEDMPFERICIDSDKISIIYDKQKIDTAQILKHLLEKCKLQDMHLHEPDLEGTIKKIYAREE